MEFLYRNDTEKSFVHLSKKHMENRKFLLYMALLRRQNKIIYGCWNSPGVRDFFILNATAWLEKI